MALWRKISIAVVSALTLSLMLAIPANATTPAATGDIYYWGAWDNNLNSYLGMRKYNLETGTDQRLGTGSPTCATAIGAPSGLAVDQLHNKIYWSVNDGNVGIFAMDLSTGTCYTVTNEWGVFGLEVVPTTQTLIWGGYDGAQNLGYTSVSDLTSIPAATHFTPNIAGGNSPRISDIVFNGNKLYYLVNDGTVSVYSTPANTPSVAFTLEKATPLANNINQLGVTDTHFYFNIEGLQIVRAARNGSDLIGYLDVNQVSGFAIAGDKLYGMNSRDTVMKSIALSQTDQVMSDLPGNPRPDMFAYLRYTNAQPTGLVKPTITANNTKTSSGTASIPFSGSVVNGTKKLFYQIKPTDNSGDLTGYCTVSGNKCVVSGLDDTKTYKVQLALAFTYQDGANFVPTVASATSNEADINAASTPSNGGSDQTFRGFEFERAALTAGTKADISNWLSANNSATKVYCTGYTGFNWHHRTPWSLRNLATKRAQNVCNYIKKLNPNIQIVSVKAVNESSKRAATRRVYVKLQ